MVILVATSWPSPRIGPEVAGADKLVHFGMYAVFGWLTARALVERSAPRLAAAIGALALFAALDELHQVLIPGRSASVLDWLADAAGLVAGLLLGARLLSLAPSRQDPTP